MRRQDVIAKLRATEPALRHLGVGALFLFGSHARDNARDDSDIDVFVDPVSAERFGFLPFMSAYETICRAVGNDLDVGYSTREGLDPYIRPEAERQAVRVF
jgi:uncharacterized protein